MESENKTTNQHQQQVLIEENQQTQKDKTAAEIDLDFSIDLSKAKKGLSNMFDFFSSAFEDTMPQSEIPVPAIRIQADDNEEEKEPESNEGNNDEDFSSFSHIQDEEEETAENRPYAEVDINFFSSSKKDGTEEFEPIAIQNYTLILNSPAVKKYVKLTSVISLIQLISTFIITRTEIFGYRHCRHFKFGDFVWLGALMISSSMMIKKFKSFRHLRKTTLVFLFIDTVIALQGYSMAFWAPTILSLIYLASVTVSLSILILNSTSLQISQKKAFKFTYLLYVIITFIVFFVFNIAFEFLSLGEKVLVVGVIGYIAGHVASSRLSILGERLEMKDMSITLEDCIVIGVGASTKGLFISLKKISMQFMLALKKI